LFLGRVRGIGAEADKRRFLEEAAGPGASISDGARRYGIDRRILYRMEQELSPPAFCRQAV
jgi:transposase-like protein